MFFFLLLQKISVTFGFYDLHVYTCMCGVQIEKKKNNVVNFVQHPTYTIIGNGYLNLYLFFFKGIILFYARTHRQSYIDLCTHSMNESADKIVL